MRQQLLLIYISILVFLIPIFYSPTLVDTQQYFDVAASDVQRTVTFFQIGVLSSSIILGLFGNNFGKKKLLLFGLGLSALGSLMSGLAPSIDLLAVSRLIQGAGANIGVLLGFALIVQLYDEKASLRIFTLLGVISGISLAITPFLAEFLVSNYGTSAASYLFFICSCALTVETFLILDKKVNQIEKTTVLESILEFREILTNRTFLSYAMITPAIIAGFWFIFSFFPFYLENNLKYDGIYFSALVSFLMALYAIGNYAPRVLESKFSQDRIILIGIHLVGIGLVCLLMAIVFGIYTELFIVLALVFYALSFGVVSPGSISMAMSANLKLAVKSAAARALIIAILNYVATGAAEWSDTTNLSHLFGFLLITYIVALAFFFIRPGTK